MSTPTPTPTGLTIGQILEQVVFSDPDPRVQQLRRQWEEVQREVQALFETACRDQHAYRLRYHRGCGTPDAATQALRDLALIRPMLAEEREQRLSLLWQDIYRKVGRVLAEKVAERVDPPCGPSAGSDVTHG